MEELLGREGDPGGKVRRVRKNSFPQHNFWEEDGANQKKNASQFRSRK